MLDVDTLLQGRYRIIHLINQGNMGAVYLAEDIRLGNDVALKETFSAGSEAELREQFHREARLLSKLRHPSLPRVIDHFIDGSGQFLVMDYIVGKDLEELMRDQRGPFPVDKVLGWADQLLEVLIHLHTQGEPVIHRDIKPANIKLTPQDKLILLDFGLAKGSTASLKMSLRAATPAYAPFEQVTCQGTDARSDLYALAVTLYHLMTGELPPIALQRSQIIWKGNPDPLVPANHLNAQVPLEVAQVLTRAMALQADDRPASASEMREALRNAQEEAERKRRAEQERRAREEAERRRQQQEEARQVREAAEALRQQREQEERARQAREEAAALQAQREQEERKRRAAAEAKALRQEQERQAREAAERRQRQEAERKAQEETERLRQQEAREKKARAETETLTPPTASLWKPPEKQVRTEAWQRRRTLILRTSIGLMLMALFLLPIVMSLKKPELSSAGMQTTSNQTSTETSALKELISSFVQIPAGEFMMGSENGDAAEKPVHRVRISHDFEMGKYEVTQAQWEEVMRSSPSRFKGANLPVENVSWYDAREFIKKLNERNDGYTYSLPTEAEWEYACRAGNTEDDLGNFGAMAWYKNNSGGKTHPVGQKQPNAWGLYDMHGNVWEWVQDWYEGSYYGQSPGIDPTGPESGSGGLRGGSWYNSSSYLRSAHRGTNNRDYQDAGGGFGFRLVRTLRNKTS